MTFAREIESEYDTRCYFNVRSKADMSQLNLPQYNRRNHKLIDFRVWRCFPQAAGVPGVLDLVLNNFKKCPGWIGKHCTVQCALLRR